MGKNGVCHFEIKGCRNWKFGIWITDNESERVCFFAQHTINIDKFKPSRSYYCQVINKEAFDRIIKSNEKLPWDIYYVIRMIQEIKSHPILAFYKDLTEETYLPSSFNIFKDVIGAIYENFAENIRDKVKNFFTVVYNKSKIFFMTKNKIIYEIEFNDRNKDGFRSYPRYSRDIVFNDGTTDEEQDNFIKFWKLEKYEKNISTQYFIEKED
jgi:hypothetical protein